MFDLTGRVALVTGAGRHTGAGIARSLAERGAAVAVNDRVGERAREVVRALDGEGRRARAVVFDVTDRAAVERGVAEVEDTLGPVDVLVNNAGIPEPMILRPFRETPPDDWARYVDLNLYGVLHCTRAVVDGMCRRGWGRIVTISSGAGQVGLPIGVSLYGASKGGAIAFMRHLALEVATSGVTANTLALGLMDTAADADTVASLAKTIPVGRAGSPRDVGAAVVYLCSDEAGWLTAQTIGLNGGSVTG